MRCESALQIDQCNTTCQRSRKKIRASTGIASSQRIARIGQDIYHILSEDALLSNLRSVRCFVAVLCKLAKLVHKNARSNNASGIGETTAPWVARKSSRPLHFVPQRHSPLINSGFCRQRLKAIRQRPRRVARKPRWSWCGGICSRMTRAPLRLLLTSRASWNRKRLASRGHTGSTRLSQVRWTAAAACWWWWWWWCCCCLLVVVVMVDGGGAAAAACWWWWWWWWCCCCWEVAVQEMCPSGTKTASGQREFGTTQLTLLLACSLKLLTVLNYALTVWLTKWTNLLSDWPTTWLNDWPTVWQTDGLTDCLTDRPIDRIG